MLSAKSTVINPIDTDHKNPFQRQRIVQRPEWRRSPRGAAGGRSFSLAMRRNVREAGQPLSFPVSTVAAARSRVPVNKWTCVVIGTSSQWFQIPKRRELASIRLFMSAMSFPMCRASMAV